MCFAFPSDFGFSLLITKAFIVGNVHIRFQATLPTPGRGKPSFRQAIPCWEMGEQGFRQACPSWAEANRVSGMQFRVGNWANRVSGKLAHYGQR